MPNLYQTDDMEASLLHLAANNRTVIVYMRHKCNKPIRLRLNLVKDLPIELCKIWKPFAQATIERWQANGGVMIYRPHPTSNKENVPEADAMLIIEAPFSMDDYNRITRNVRQEVVVYRPPTWELHNESMEGIFPRAGTYITMEAIFKSLVGRELTEDMEGALAATGYPRASTAVFTAWDIEQLTGWDEKFLKQATRHRYRYKMIRWHVFGARLKPRDNEALEWGWSIITAQDQLMPRVYGMRFGLVKGGYVPGFTTQLKRLCHEGYLSREDNIYCINMDGPPLQIDRLDAINNMYRGRFFKIKTLVDEAPEHYYD